MKPCLSQTLTLPGTFAADIAAYAEAGCDAVEIWLTKLEDHRRHFSPEQTRQLLADYGIKPVAAAYQGGILLSEGQQRREQFDQFQRRLSLCQELGIPTLILAADFADKADLAYLDRACKSLQQVAQLAAAYDVRLALEFHTKARWCSSLETAIALVEACRQPNLGICLDVFHFHAGPSKLHDLGLLTPEQLFHVQVCDVSGTLREFAQDADRILPGDGDLPLHPILERLRQISYTGWVSVEVFNPTLWQINAVQVAAMAWQAVQRLLGNVSSPSSETRSKPEPASPR
ncbi:MAG: sugar phosphate isomerase/epimerase [Gemmatales bacterium]|nr:sugar phosphate isomerase/epimerase [Gemmatales bacterium]MDW8385946.1 sugar phosphate isomerase/epimerase [Gemmatales bacterium]